MADETKTILIDVEVETQDFDQAIGEVNTQVRKNREEIKELSKDYEANAKTIAKLENENRDLAKSKQQLVKESKTEANSLNALRLKLAEQVKERNNVNTSTKEGAARFKELQVSIKGLNDQISGFEQAGGDFRRNVGNYPNLASDAAAGFKKLWATLLANPLILLVAAVAGLIKVFKESQTGAEFFRKTGAALNTTLGFLSDIVEKLGGFLIRVFEDPKQALVDFGNLIKNNILTRFEGMLEFIPQISKAIGLLFEGEFSQAGEVAANALGKVVLGVENVTEKVAASITSFKEYAKELNTATRAAFALEERLIANEKALADQRVAQAQSIASQKELNLLIEDQTASFEDRLAAADQFAAVEAAQIAESIRLQQERIEILKAQNDLTNSTEEDIQRVRDAEIELANLRAASLEREVTNQNKRNTVINQQAAKEEKDRQIRLAGLKREEDAIADAYEQEVAAEKALLDLKKKNDQAALDSTLQVINQAGALGKKGAIVALGIDTAKAIGGLTAASEENPANGATFGLAGIAQFAAGLLRIAANIAQAKQALSKGGGSVSSTSSAGTGTAAVQIAGLSNVNGSLLSQFSQPAQNQATQAQITASAMGAMPNPVVSVVDITTAQSSRAVKVAESTL